jgi:hypothetical protein
MDVHMGFKAVFISQGLQENFRTCKMHPTYGWLSKSLCHMEHKVFFVLHLKDRLNTRGLLHRRNMNLESYTCVCIWQHEKAIQPIVAMQLYKI